MRPPPSRFPQSPRKILSICALAAGLAYLAAAPAPAQSQGDELSFKQLHDSVDPDRQFRMLELLTGAAVENGNEPIASRNIHHPHHAVAAEYIEAELARIPGLTLRSETFVAEGERGMRNIIGELPAGDRNADPDAGWIIVGAHWDSIADLDDDETWDAAVDPAPGADDNASGVAAVLEIARLLADWPGGFSHPIRFIFFDAEEYGLLGAWEHVAKLTAAGESVRVMLSLDPVGYNSGGSSILWFSYDDRWARDASAMEDLAGRLRSTLDVTGVDEALIGGDQRSDHFPFWDAGFSALHLGSFPQPPVYHTMGDTLDVVDPDYLKRVTGLAAAYVAEIAEPLPAVTGRGCGS